MFKKSLVLVIILVLSASSVFAQSRITQLLHERINRNSHNLVNTVIHQRILCIDGYKYIQMFQDNRASTPTLTQMYENNPSMTPRLATCKN